MQKFGIMYRESFLRALRNTTRQRRAFRRYFEDVSILVGEANFTDEAMTSITNKPMKFENVPCLTLSVNLYTSSMLDYLYKGMELELVLTGDLAEHCMYLSYIHEMCV